MAKKKQDAAKEAAKKAAKAAKQDKKTARSTKKKGKKDGDESEEDVEAILRQLQAEESKKVAVTVTVTERPSARANFSLCALPSGELVMFGGEFNDGRSNTCFNDLYRFTPGPHGSYGAGEWRQVSSPATPTHRCSHQAAVVGNAAMFVICGEFASNSQFYHFNDTHRLELSTNKWSRVESRRGPSARSGHRVVAWRNSVVLFGGFHQSWTQEKWFGDLWVLDCRVGQWAEVAFPGTALVPSARSGHQFHIVPGRDQAILYGGFSEIKPDAGGGGGKGGGKPLSAAVQAAALASRKSQAVVHTDLWVLRLGPLLSPGGVPSWERVRCAGVPPTPRSAFAMAMYRDRALVFGGVADADGDAKGETLVSTFFADLHSLDIDKRRWHALELKKVKAAGGRRARGGRGGAAAEEGGAAGAAALGDDDAASLGSGDGDGADADDEAADAAGGGGGGHELDDDAFYYMSGGKLVRYVEEEEEEENGEEEAGAAEAGAAEAVAPLPEAGVAATAAAAVTPGPEAAAGGSPPAPPPSAAASEPAALSSAPAAATEAPAPPAAPTPCPRMKAAAWVSGHSLYVFGGLHEGRVRETTLDDLWCIDLRERTRWECLLPARPHAWLGETSDDEAADDEEDDDEDGGSDDDDDEEEDEDGDGGSGSDSSKSDGGAGGGAESGASPTRAGARGGHGPSSGGDAARLRSLRDHLGMEDASVTPAPGEALRDFFARTAATWVLRYGSTSLADGERIEGKQLRRRAFGLAQARYDLLWPVLEELKGLEEEQRIREALAAAASSSSRAGGGAGGRRGKTGGGR